MKKNFSSFLVINPFGIGDLLFSTPLIRNLHENFPGSAIHYFCKNHTAGLARIFPHVDSVIEYDRDAIAALQKKSPLSWCKAFYDLIARMRNVKADACFDLSLNSQYGFMAMCAGIPQRIGYDYKGRGMFLNRKIKFGGYCSMHVADYYLGLLPSIGISPKRYPMSVTVKDEDRQWARVEASGKEGMKRVCLVPGGGSSWGKDAHLKQWSSEKFAGLADRLIQECRSEIVLLGNGADSDSCRRVAGAMKHQSLDLCGATTLGRTMAVIDDSSLVIANDSGLFHIAQALGKKVLGIFGPVDDRVYGPYPDSSACTVLKRDLPCRPCYNKFRLNSKCADRRCLETISVEEVFAAARSMLTK